MGEPHCRCTVALMQPTWKARARTPGRALDVTYCHVGYKRLHASAAVRRAQNPCGMQRLVSAVHAQKVPALSTHAYTLHTPSTPVGHMSTLAIHKRTDDVAQSCEGQIDFDTFLQAIT